MSTVTEQDKANAARWISETEGRIVAFAVEIMDRERITLREAAYRALSLPAVKHLADEVERLGGESMTVERLARLMAAAIDAPAPVAPKPEPSTADTLKAVAAVDALFDETLAPVVALLEADGLSKTRARAEALRLVPAAWSAHCQALEALAEGASLFSLRADAAKRAARLAAVAGTVRASAKPGSYAKALRESLAA